MNKDAFIGLTKLEYLNIRHNKIKNVEQNLFRDFVSLTELSLSDNEIEVLQPNLFTNCKKLEKIYFSRNKISAINKNTFNGLEKLQNLSLLDNNLKILERNTFGDLKFLKKIWLSKNKIQSVDKNAFSGAISLDFVNLSDNQISQLSKETFATFPRLAFLYLSNNVCISKNFNKTTMKSLKQDISIYCDQADLVDELDLDRDSSACIIPQISNGIVLDTLDNKTQQSGTVYSDWVSLKVNCDYKYYLLADSKGIK